MFRDLSLKGACSAVESSSQILQDGSEDMIAWLKS